MAHVKRAQTEDQHNHRLLMLTIVNLGAVLLLIPVESYVAERHWLTTGLAYMPQQPFVLPVIWLLVRSIRLWNRRMMATNAAVLVLVLFTLLGFNVPLGKGGSGPSIRVMTYSLDQGANGIRNIARVVEDIRPEVLCVQEVNSWGKHGDPVRQLQRLLPKGWHVARDGELAILSRYPIRHSEVHYLLTGTGRAVFQAVLDVRGRNLTVLTTHFNVAAGRRSLAHNDLGFFNYLRHTASVRLDEQKTLIDVASKVHGPLLITGDLNTPPRGRVYGRIAQRYRDCFRAAGWGFGWTYRAGLPCVRIDHVFTDRSTPVLRCFVPAVRASDHRPVVADIVIR